MLCQLVIVFTFGEIIEVEEAEDAFLTSPLSFNENHLCIINDAVGVSTVYNCDSRLHLAPDEIRGKFKVRECNGNY